MKTRIISFLSSRKFYIFLAFSISLVSLWLAFRDVQLDELYKTISQANLFFIIMALLSVLLNNGLKIIRWWTSMGERGKPDIASGVVYSFFTGQLINTFSPVRMGEISRILVVGSGNTGHAFVAGTIMIEKTLDLGAYGLICAALLLGLKLPDWINTPARAIVVFAIAASTFLVLISLFNKFFIHWFSNHGISFSEQMNSKLIKSISDASSSLEVLKKSPSLGKLVLLTVLIWITAILTNQLILSSMHFSLPLIAPLLILVVLQAGISLPSMPGKIGIFEYACVLALSVFGINKEESLSYGILLHLTILLPMIVLGLISTLFHRDYGESGLHQGPGNI